MSKHTNHPQTNDALLPLSLYRLFGSTFELSYRKCLEDNTSANFFPILWVYYLKIA